MDTMKTLMPLIPKGEGVWAGEYIYVDPMGVVLQQHKSRLVCVFPTRSRW